MIPQALKDLFKSKKFYLTVIGSAICAGLAYAHVDNHLIAVVAGLFGTNTLSQGIADHGAAQ